MYANGLLLLCYLSAGQSMLLLHTFTIKPMVNMRAEGPVHAETEYQSRKSCSASSLMKMIGLITYLYSQVGLTIDDTFEIYV